MSERATVLGLVAAACFQLGCGATRTTTMIATRDPQAVVAVEIKPWNDAHVTVAREPTGALVAKKAEGDVPPRTLVSAEGRIATEDASTVDIDADAARVNLWTTYDVPGAGAKGTPKILAQVALRTPLANVIEVRERREPATTGGPIFLAIAAAFFAGSGFAGYGAATGDRGPGERAGLAILSGGCAVLGLMLITDGIHRMVGRPEERVLFASP